MSSEEALCRDEGDCGAGTNEGNRGVDMNKGQVYSKMS